MCECFQFLTKEEVEEIQNYRVGDFYVRHRDGLSFKILQVTKTHVYVSGYPFTSLSDGIAYPIEVFAEFFEYLM